MIAGRAKKNKTERVKGQGYSRRKHQRTEAEFLTMNDSDRAYARSAIDAPQIEYNETGAKV